MKAPTWLGIRRGHVVTEASGRGSFSVTLSASAQRYTDAMWDLLDELSDIAYRKEITAERRAGEDYIDRLMYDLAEHYGLSQDARFMSVAEFRKFRNKGSPGGATWTRPLAYADMP